ncbi:MAG TPA: right-handed parallel beta-helix repeat-containing protein, partial [Saprospiraceae bacterium]|nr:right-handed parallel beta-helix repeat-containing protein [Saprospiraceae bacterium]
MVRTRPISFTCHFVYRPGQFSWSFLPALLWLLVPFTSSQAQYIIQTDGVFDPVYNNPIDITLLPDEISGPLDIGFDFNFFGNTYADFAISSNGFISFQVGGESGTSPQTIPDPADPNDLIALGWGALLPDYIYITYETMGTAPYRTLHVNFFIEDYDEPLPCASGYVLSGQIILYETTNIIELHTDYWDGGDCNTPSTQGIENEDGSIAFYDTGRNNALWNTSETLVRFVPEDYENLAVMALDPVFCEGLRDIRIQVQNVGIASVDTFYVDWTWDGVPQDSINVYTSLPVNSITEVVLGQKTIGSDTSYMLKAWTYNPENHIDNYTLNDTINVPVKGGLEGTYTIGGASPDYATITDAMTSLINSGACDSVIFNIRPGTYTEELDIPYLTIATGAVVIFQSETNNPDDVIITKHYTTGSSNRMIEITNASHIHFKNLTLRVTGTVCSSAVYLNSFCADVRFSGCKISAPTCNSTSTSGAVISLVNGQKDNIGFENNVIRKGSYGLYVSPGSLSLANDLVIEGNSIDSAYRHGMYLNRVQGMDVTDNTVFSPSSAFYGIETNTTYGPIRLEQNNIYVPQGVYGLRVYRHNYNAPPSPDTLYILNNMINLGGAVSGTRSMSLEQSSLVNAWHNTIHTTSTSSTSYAFYSTGNTLSDLRNSVITNFGPGRAAWMTAITSDHNDYYCITPPLISNGTNYTTLEDWVLVSGQDHNSIQIDPEYVSATDLHVGHGALNGAGDTLQPAVTLDIDD